jgi:monoamine oxidase
MVVLAQSLKKQGCSSLMLLEGRDRIGGRIFTESLLGHPIDLGARYYHLYLDVDLDDWLRR